MDRYEFLKEWYHQENGRHLSLNDSLNIPIGVLTGIFAAIFFYVTGFGYKNGNEILLIIFILCIGALVVLCFITAYYLLLSYNNLLKGYVYKYLAEATKWNEHLQNLKIYYKENTIYFGDNVDDNAEKRLREDLIEGFAQYIDHNVLNNDRKSGYLHKAKQYLFVTLIATVVTFIPFGFHFFNKEQETSCQRIEITNIDSLNNKVEKLTQFLIIQKMSKENIVPPPAPPPPRLIKEGDQPKPPVPSNPNK